MKTAVETVVEKLEALIPAGNQLLIRGILMEGIEKEIDNLKKHANIAYASALFSAGYNEFESNKYADEYIDKFYNKNK